MHKLITTTLGAALCIAGACADENANTDARGEPVDVATAQSALTALTTNVDTTVTGVNTMSSGDGTLTLDCASGGSANVTGHVNVVPVPVMVDVNVAIDYNGCTSDSGTQMAGTIDFTQTVQAGSVPVRVQTVYQGNVAFTGNIEADCLVDLNVLVDEAGRTVEVSGSFCGRAASELDLQVMPRWAN